MSALRAGLLGALVLACVWALAPAQASEVNSLPQRLKACHDIGEIKARVACYDHLTEESLAAAAQTPALPAPASAVANSATRPLEAQETEAKASTQPAPASQPPQTSASIIAGDVAKLRLVVTNASVNSDQMLRIATTDGAIWVQTQPLAFKVGAKPGDALAIKKTFLGGYWCQAGSGREFHCMPDRATMAGMKGERQ